MRREFLAQEVYTHHELSNGNPRVSMRMTINTMALFSSDCYMIESIPSLYEVINAHIYYIHPQAVFDFQVHL